MSLTEAGCRGRRERLMETVEKEFGTNFVVISNPRHIFYLTGYFSSQLTLGGWGNNHLVLDGDRSTLVIHNFFGPEPTTVFVDEFASWKWYDGATDAGTMMFPDGVKQLNKHLKTGQRIGVEIGWFPLGAAVGIEETIDITPTILRMRRHKDADELMLIREAIAAVEAGHRAAREVIKPGLTELAVYNAVYNAIVEQAGHAVLPLGDFAGHKRKEGEASSSMASRHVLQAGELMILDIYPIVNGYRADFTATVSTDGHLTEQQKALESALHEAQARGEEKLKPGTPAREVYQAVRDGMPDFAEFFTHHAGHGLGLGHPEAPFFVPGSDEIVLAGDVVTLEPGAYGEGFAARIEHNYLITEDGYERLTNQKTSFA